MTVLKLEVARYTAPVLNLLHRGHVWIGGQLTPPHLANPPLSLLYEVATLHYENHKLRELLSISKTPLPDAALSAEVFFTALDGNASTLMTYGGIDRGIEVQMPVLDAQGLIGRVQTVTPQAARILTVADPNFRVPVQIGSRGTEGIAAGEGPHSMRILYFQNLVGIAQGDTVVTSGHGGVFPPGIPVGYVSQVSPVVKITLAADLRKVRFVRLLPPALVPEEK